MSSKQQFGFAQRIRFSWIEYVGGLALSGKPADEAWQELTAYLDREISTGSNAKRGSREKVRTVLAQVWLNVQEQLEPMRQHGLKLLRELPANDHLAVHWGMTMAVYPFWGAVAGTVGKLTALQKGVQTTQIQRRIREQFGERESVRVSTRRAFGSFVEWGVLEQTKEKATYALAPKRTVNSPVLASWLLEAVLRQPNRELLPVSVAARSPALFPFVLPRITSQVLAYSNRIEVVRHGLDEEILKLVR